MGRLVQKGGLVNGAKRAVVIGASIGGLCAARALADTFDEVTVLEADTLPSEPVGRRGTPQAWHNHLLLGAGREAMEELFPGFTKRLLNNGGCVIDPGVQAATCLANGWSPRSATGMEMYFSSRPLVELTLRECVAEHRSITIVERARVEGLSSRSAGDQTTVTGVVYRDPDGEQREMTADLVVDAGGRGSRSRTWMSQLGIEIDEMTLDAKVSYSSRWYRWPTADLPWYRFLTVFPDPNPNAPEPHQYLCSIFPIEDDSFIAVMGSWGLDMPTDTVSFETAARQTRTREFAWLLDRSQPLSDVHHTRSTRNVWRRYDRITRPPAGFVALGDAVCAFNPIYAQGMSCASTAALILKRLLPQLDHDAVGFASTFYREQAKFLKGAWLLAFSRDVGYEKASGTEALPHGLRKRMVRATTWPIFEFIAQACWGNDVIQYHFNRVYNLQETVIDLLRNPRVLRAIASHGVNTILRRTTLPPTGAAELPPPDTDYTALRTSLIGTQPAPASR